MPWDKAKKTEGDVLKEYAISNGIASEKIFVGFVMGWQDAILWT